MSLALPSRPLLLGPFLGPVDPAVVALQPVSGLLVAGDVHQLQVLGGEKQTVEVLPVHLPPVLDGSSQCGHHGALLLYSAKSGTDSPSAVRATHRRALCLPHQPPTPTAQCLPQQIPLPYWSDSCQPDTGQGHLGRGNLN